MIGLDLAGSPRRDTGVCVFSGPRSLRTTVLHSDDEILGFVRSEHPDLVVIDAPLSLPWGRRTIDDRTGPHFRECDRVLLRMRVPFFPITLGPMRMLTARGIAIASAIRGEGPEVLEGYPGGAQDLLGLPRKREGVRRVQRALRSRGLGGELDRRALTHDELDAVTIAWVGWMYRKGRGTIIGDPSEGVLLLPEPRRGTSFSKKSGRAGQRHARR